MQKKSIWKKSSAYYFYNCSFLMQIKTLKQRLQRCLDSVREPSWQVKARFEFGRCRCGRPRSTPKILRSECAIKPRNVAQRSMSLREQSIGFGTRHYQLHNGTLLASRCVSDQFSLTVGCWIQHCPMAGRHR